MFGKDCCEVNLSDMNAIVTEPYFNFPSIQEGMTEIFFEEYGCNSLLRINSKSLREFFRITHFNFKFLITRWQFKQFQVRSGRPRKPMLPSGRFRL